MIGLLDWVARAEATAGSDERGIHVADGDAWTYWPYSRLARLTRAVAAGLTVRGIGPGDVVLVVQRSGPGFVATFFGVLLAGATPSPAAPRAPFRTAHRYDDHLAALLAVARPAAVVADDDLVAGLRSVACAVPCLSVGELMAGEAGEAAPAAGTAAALLQFTSGSSGRPRGVRVTADALAANIGVIRTWLRWRPEDACASWLPVHHDMGLIGCLLTPVVTGSTLWLMQPEQFVGRPERYLRCFGRGGARVTAMPSFGPAHILRRVRPDRLGDLDLSGWRAAVIGAERVDPAVLAGCEDALAPLGLRPGTLLPAYGLAEATLAVTGVPVGRTRRVVHADPASLTVGARVRTTGAGEQGRSVAGCGPPLAGVRVAVVGPDRTELPDGHVGEIVVRGRSVAAGYVAGVGQPASSSTIDRGALLTGDAGFLDRGELFVIGRLGDSLKVAGRSVYAEDLEAVLGEAGLPVRRLAVALGTHRGRPTAVAVLEEHTSDRADLARRLVRAAAGGADVVVVTAGPGSVPRTSSGKPRRRALWESFQESVDAIPSKPSDSGSGRSPALLTSDRWKRDRKQKSGPPSVNS